jgi:hypothetical protein
MSTKYKHGDRVPSDVICKRLHELASAVSEGRSGIEREFYMRIPAELDHDADLVIGGAARRIEELEIQAREYSRLKDLVRDALAWGMNPPDETIQGYNAIKAGITGRLLAAHLGSEPSTR